MTCRLILFFLLLGYGTLYAQVNLTQGLVAYYPFNGNANDASGNGFHGQLRNGVTFVPDKFGVPNSAVHFDGIDDFIEVMHNGALSRRSAFSYVVMFKTETLSTVQTLLGRRKADDQTKAQFQAFINWSAEPGAGYGHHYTNNAECGTVIIPYNLYVNTGPATINVNQWHCVVGTFDGVNQNIYLDGVLKESRPTPLPLIDSCDIVPMRIAKYTDPDPQYFKGAMDEVRIYNRALNLAEVEELCVVCPDLEFDFNYTIDPCDPYTVQFNGSGAIDIPDGDFGDGNVWTGSMNPAHTYTSLGNYQVAYYVSSGQCRDTVKKTISLQVIPDNSLITTPDTTICLGKTKKILTSPALDYCWTPTTYLDDPNSPQPTTSTPQNITYYYTAGVTGANLITNGSFTSGNTGFTSDYSHATPNSTEGQYFVGTNPNSWNSALSNCNDHTSGNGNMLLVNGSPTNNAVIWKQTVTVVPNTNYAFSVWIQSLSAPNPAQLQFAINGKPLGGLINASSSTCAWNRFYTTWNSGDKTGATISIINKNTQAAGNDFALDDISFATLFIKQDSIKISVDTPLVTTGNDVMICKGESVQLGATGAQTYSWSPANGLSNSTISNPVASPLSNTQYVVTGINNNGCIDTDTINVELYPVPQISVSNDTAICQNTSVQLFASGGNSYSWSPSGTLSSSTIANPVASPSINTIYHVSISDANCTYQDSVRVDIRPPAVFAISPNSSICLNDTVQVSASGGDIYTWQPAASLSNNGIANPRAFPTTTTTYSVTITESTCNESTVLTTEVEVNPLPIVTASKSNDIDCSIDKSQLLASGAVSYSWSPFNTLSNSAIFNPVATPAVSTEYIVKGTDLNGCEDYATITVNVENANKGGYLMPTAFTPNNDGLNDCYRIRYWGVIYELDFSIYNRWGERIFQTKDPSGCWNGIYNGVKQSAGVYVYVIRARTNCESEVFRKGTFALIR